VATQYIAAWKSGASVRWRGVSGSEYRQFTQNLSYQSPLEVYIDLYRAVLLDGPDVEEAPAGIVEFIGKSMLETNPFSGRYDYIKFALDSSRQNQTYMEHGKALIAGLFRYTFEEIDSWDADTFFDRLAKAEFIAGKQLEPEDPKAAEAAAASAKNPRGQPPPRRPKKPLTAGQQLALERRQNNN
jgi:hypothetical protein